MSVRWPCLATDAGSLRSNSRGPRTSLRTARASPQLRSSSQMSRRELQSIPRAQSGPQSRSRRARPASQPERKSHVRKLHAAAPVFVENRSSIVSSAALVENSVSPKWHTHSQYSECVEAQSNSHLQSSGQSQITREGTTTSLSTYFPPEGRFVKRRWKIVEFRELHSVLRAD